MDIRTKSLKKPVDVAEYLFTRLHQAGVRSIHGVPGDYNLVALDYIPKAGLKWVGNCNELNAAYAADGYARVKGMGAVVTTFGVGELSAINGIAGAYSEMVPVVHIVGCPSTISERNGMLLHHTLGNGDFNVFANMNTGISCYAGRLRDPSEIATQIDHALRECWLKSRPVYLTLPTDMATKKIEGERLSQPIDLEEPANETDREDYAVETILKYLHDAQRPCVLVDACAIRHRVLPEVRALLAKTGLPCFVTPMGKGAIDETDPCYGGVYSGDASHEPVREMVESSDLVLSIGALQSDFNTAGFSFRLSRLVTIDLHSDRCSVRYSEYPGVRMRGVLRKVTERLDTGKLQVRSAPKYQDDADAAAAADDGAVIKHAQFWPRIRHFLHEKDIVVTETGTANFGIWDTKFPKGVTALNQTLWGSIGWAVGACQGAALAALDAHKKDGAERRRTVLFEGDGSFQLTAQEVSTMMRHNLDVVLFVLCNDGYTIERYIHGMDAVYNDVVNWRYKDLVDVFTPTSPASFAGLAKKYSVATWGELDKLLSDKDFNERRGLRFVEVYMPREDAPRSLKMTAEASARNNAKED